jgi:hypothetical protein
MSLAVERGVGEVESAARAPGLRALLETAGLVVAPTTLVTALAYYFGVRRQERLAGYFGIDTSILGFSVQDYVLRSADALFPFLLVLLLVALLAVWFHSGASRWIDAGRRRRELRLGSAVLVGIGSLLLAFAVAALFRPLPFRPYFLLPPASLGAGAAMIAYGAWMHRALETPAGEPGDEQSGRRRLAGVVLAGMLVVLSCFWTASVYAQALGQGRAEALAAQLQTRPGVVVYSDRRLHLNPPGVVETRLDGQDARYRYRYTGLRLLVRGESRFILVPASWNHADGVAIVLPDDDSLRLEFLAGTP